MSAFARAILLTLAAGLATLACATSADPTPIPQPTSIPTPTARPTRDARPTEPPQLITELLHLRSRPSIPPTDGGPDSETPNDRSQLPSATAYFVIRNLAAQHPDLLVKILASESEAQPCLTQPTPTQTDQQHLQADHLALCLQHAYADLPDDAWFRMTRADRHLRIAWLLSLLSLPSTTLNDQNVVAVCDHNLRSGAPLLDQAQDNTTLATVFLELALEHLSCHVSIAQGMDVPTVAPPTPTPHPGILAQTLLATLEVSESNWDVPYNRNQWLHWTDADRDCFNTRAEVLIEETRIPLVLDDCRVVSGEWITPWSRETFRFARLVQVDHHVPLANAHRSGGYAWDHERKEDFANDLSYPGALNATQSAVNQSKGAKSPDQWRPHDRNTWCQYALDWIHIKHQWELTVTQPEHDTLDQMLTTCDGSR